MEFNAQNAGKSGHRGKKRIASGPKTLLNWWLSLSSFVDAREPVHSILR